MSQPPPPPPPPSHVLSYSSPQSFVSMASPLDSAAVAAAAYQRHSPGAPQPFHHGPLPPPPPPHFHPTTTMHAFHQPTLLGYAQQPASCNMQQQQPHNPMGQPAPHTAQILYQHQHPGGQLVAMRPAQYAARPGATIYAVQQAADGSQQGFHGQPRILMHSAPPQTSVGQAQMAYGAQPMIVDAQTRMLRPAQFAQPPMRLAQQPAQPSHAGAIRAALELRPPVGARPTGVAVKRPAGAPVNAVAQQLAGDAVPPRRTSPPPTWLFQKLLDKRKLDDLVKEIDPTEQLDEDVKDVLLQLTDDFVERVISDSCRLAKQRKSATLEAKDVQLCLERNWNMWVPGFGTDNVRPYKKAAVTEAHKQRMNTIKKTLKKP